MIDPITALATATAVFNGIKQAVAVGREAQDIFGQLGKWAGAVSDLQEWMNGESEKKPSISWGSWIPMYFQPACRT